MPLSDIYLTVYYIYKGNVIQNNQCYTSLQIQVSTSYLWTYSSGN
jgi:hypothetical protein